jgi:hypothetical protein
MSGCPIRPVRHIYKNRGLVTNYTTTGGVCKICPPPPPPPPPRPPVNIRFRVQWDLAFTVSFSIYGGSGFYDLGDGILLPFSAISNPITITGVVPLGGTVLIYDSNILIFQTVDQPISFLDVSNSATLTVLTCNQSIPFHSSLAGSFDITANVNLNHIDFTNTAITDLVGVTSCPSLIIIELTGASFTQTTADLLVNDLITNGQTFGTLSIINQVSETIDTNDPYFQYLINNLNWSIT